MLKEPPALPPFLGKTIDKICQRSIIRDKAANHCAHFVSHVMEYDSLPHTCKNQSTADKLLPDKGAALRVNEIFNVAPEVGHWADRPLGLTSCLIFATISGNMRECGDALSMDEHPRKHVGIYRNGVIWHYGLTRYGVVKDQEMMFIIKFKHEYITAGDTVKFFYGRFLK